MVERKFPDLADHYLVRVCEMFLDRRSTRQIADWLNQEFRREGIHYAVTREQIYALINDARRRGYFSLHPPLNMILARRLAEVYLDGSDVGESRIAVVSARGPSALDHVASEAAALTLRLIQEVGRVKKQVHLGLGAGSTTLRIARHLATLLRAEPKLPHLVLHALSTGTRVDDPRTASVAFFTLFDHPGMRLNYVGLFAPPVVRSRDYGRVKEQPGVSKSFAVANEIDIVLTSLGSASDEHAAFNRFLEDYAEDIQLLTHNGWVGDVQYRPYSSTGPILQETSVRTVTLFELQDLLRLARTRNKYVVVVSGPCGECGRPRSDALRPLLTVPDLAVWSHLVMDMETAQELLPASLPMTW
jgi:DNA-binding transcriptional regulator LsrR (DeoR family)